MTLSNSYSQEIEILVLGCMLNSLYSLSQAIDYLDESDFFFDAHKILFLTLKEAHQKNKNIDVYIIVEDLKKQNKLENVGGQNFLLGLSQTAYSSININEYIKIIKNKSTLRKAINACHELYKEFSNNPPDIEEALDKAHGIFFKLNQNTSECGKLIQDISSEIRLIDEFKEKNEFFKTHGPKNNSITGISTGFTDLDKSIDGLQNSNLIILAARPSMGKTALALNISSYIAKNNRAVGFFSLEMKADQLIHRMVCSTCKIKSEKIKTGHTTDYESDQIITAMTEVNRYPIIIDDTGSLKINEIRARARRMKSQYDIQLLVIDYIGLISGSTKAENRQNEISDISRKLKSLAKELNIPILCLAQLSRKVEERAGHRPMMSDLRESGQIEADADIVMFLLRREYYDPNDKPGQAELIIGKNRHGPIKNISLNYTQEYALFSDYIPLSHSKYVNKAFDYMETH
jgi:replicative DNA helicase